MNRIKILIGRVESRIRRINRAVNHDKFEIRFAEFDNTIEFDSFDFVIPLSLRDARFLNRRIKQGDGKLAQRAVVASNEVIDLTDDKIRFNRFLLREFPELVPAFGNSAFDKPYLVKKRKDSGGRNTFLITNEKEEGNAANLLCDRDYFCQEYVAGDVEYTAHILFDKKILSGFTNVFSMKRDLYVRGERMKPFTDIRIRAIPLQFKQTLESVLAGIGFRGYGCFNYKIKQGKPMIFELNSRLGGSAHSSLNQLLRALFRFGASHQERVTSVPTLAIESPMHEHASAIE